MHGETKLTYKSTQKGDYVTRFWLNNDVLWHDVSFTLFPWVFPPSYYAIIKKILFFIDMFFHKSNNIQSWKPYHNIIAK
jgi:hypothetical protein